MTGPVDLDAARATIRAWRALPGPEADALVAEVEALRAENARLRDGLEAMRDGCRECGGDGDVVEVGGPFGSQNVVCVACRPAQAALGGWDA